MLDKKCEPFNQYKKSTFKDEYSYLYRNNKTNGKYYKIIYSFINKISQNCNFIQTHCNDRRNTFHFPCHQWYSYNNPGILT